MIPRTVRPVRIALVALLTVALLVPLAAPATAGSRHKPKVRTIADGLVGPLGLAVGKHGTLYVAEVFGGQLTKVTRRGTTKAVYRKDGVNVLGGVDVSRRGKVVFTLSKGPAETPAPPNRAFLAKLRRKHKVALLAALSRFEKRRNPDKVNEYGFTDLPDGCDVSEVPDIPQPQPYEGIVDSNPYAVTSHHGAYIVADAAGNDILRVPKHGRHGRIRTIAVLPPIPQKVTAEVASEFGLPECVVGQTYMSEPVPTDVERGRDGHYYVSALPGAPELPGSGAVFKVNPWSGDVRKVADGFYGAVDLAVDRHNRIYVAELFGNKISVLKHRRIKTFVEVNSPGAVEISRRGTLYATTNVFEGNGTVVKITHRRRGNHKRH